MRVSTEKVKAAILHADPDLRQAAANYFGDSFSRDPELMPLAIQAVEKHGWQAAFRNYYFLRNLVQTESTARWLIQQMREAELLLLMRSGGELDEDGEDDDEDDKIHVPHVCWRALINADSDVLRSCEAEVLASDTLDEEEKQLVRHRIALGALPVTELWSELLENCRKRDSGNQAADSNWEDRLEGGEKIDLDDDSLPDNEFQLESNVVHALSRHGDQIAEQVLEILQNPQRSSHWTVHCAILLAGEARLEAAIGPLIAIMGDPVLLLQEDDCQEALTRIGSDAVVSQLATAYVQSDEGLREPASLLFGKIHSDLSVQACIDLLKIETEELYISSLWLSLLLNFSSEGIEPARQSILDATEMDPDLVDLRRAVLNASILLDQPFDEFDEWQADAVDDAEFKDNWYDEYFADIEAGNEDDDFDESDEAEVDWRWDSHLPKAPPPDTVIHDSPRVGRNDPCPCGSGKKYKKCCYGKQDTDADLL